MQNKRGKHSLESENTHNTNQSNKRLLLFDLNHFGHHAGYIQYLVEYWKEHKPPGSLDILVTDTFTKLHQELVKMGAESESDKINFIAISPEEEALVSAKNSPLKRALSGFNEWKILCKYAAQLKTTSCLIMYFDSLQFPLFMRLLSPCFLSGIYFRPVFHYNSFAGFRPTLRERFWQLRDRLFLARILKHPQLKFLFCLDPFVVEHLGRFEGSVTSLKLPDPINIYEDYQAKTEHLKKAWKIQPGRKIFLMFGAYRPRKGIEELLSAIELLPRESAEKFCLLLVGLIGDEPTVKKRIDNIKQQLPIKVVSHTDFVPEEEIQSYFQLSDVILAPYQRHIGMSGILIRAAAAQKPVLSSSYGLMGEIVKRYSLGIAVDTQIPTKITEGICQFVEKDIQDCGDISQMKNFAQQNMAEKFASTIFNTLNKL